jgi:hypothetical protein
MLRSDQESAQRDTHEPNPPMQNEVLKIKIPEVGIVAGLLEVPERTLACYVMSHGASAGMTHPFMTAIATGLHARHIASQVRNALGIPYLVTFERLRPRL